MATRNVKVVVASLERFIQQIVQKITLDIVANLVRAPSEGGTPVDTGWARANWVPEIGFARKRTPSPRPGGTREGAVAAVPGQNVKQQAAVLFIATAYRLSHGEVSISNNVPYILKLNEGSSAQAPRAFVQAAIRKAVTVDLEAGFGV